MTLRELYNVNSLWECNTLLFPEIISNDIPYRLHPRTAQALLYLYCDYSVRSFGLKTVLLEGKQENAKEMTLSIALQSKIPTQSVIVFDQYGVELFGGTVQELFIDYSSLLEYRVTNIFDNKIDILMDY